MDQFADALPGKALLLRGTCHRVRVQRLRGRQGRNEARSLRVLVVPRAPCGRAHRTRRRAGSCRSAAACETRRSAPAGEPTRPRRTRNCDGCCYVRVRPPPPVLGTRPARAAARTIPLSRRTLRSSWPTCLGRTSAGVVPLPRSCVRQAKRTGSGACRSRAHVQHQHQVHAGIDFRVIVGPLRHAPEPVDFRQQPGQRPALAQHLEHARWLRFHQAAGELLPDPLGHERVHLAGLDHLAHQRERFPARPTELREARGEAGDAQDAHRVLAESAGHVTQHARAQIGRAAEGIDQRAVLVLRHRIDREVAPGQVLFQCHVRFGVKGEAVIAACRLALGARQRVLLARLRDAGTPGNRGRPAGNQR